MRDTDASAGIVVLVDTDGMEVVVGRLPAGRVDLAHVERIARALHDKRKTSAAFVPDPALAVSFGIDVATYDKILRACGFRAGPEGHWTWRSRSRPPPEPARPTSPAFAALKGWSAGG